MSSHAIVVERTGEPEVLTWQEVARPEPGPGEVLIRIGAAGVNFIDVYQRTGIYTVELPFTPGVEGAGRIAAVGPDVTGFAVGDRVAWSMTIGGYAEYATAPASLTVHVPDDVTDEQAAAVLLQGLTAHFLAHSVIDLEPGDTALLHAGAGGVGLLLTQFLAQRGVRVITTVSTEEKAEVSREAGAGEVIVGYRDIAERVRAFTDGDGVRVAYDGVGKDTVDASLDSLRTRGTLVLFGASSGPVDPIDPQTLSAKGSLFLTRPSLPHFIAERTELEQRANDVFSAVADGRLRLRFDDGYTVRDAAQAHRDLASRATIGKLVLRV